MDKKEIILQTVLKLVNREGFYHLNMKNVATEAGIAAGTIYIYFSSKEQLINELYKKLVKDYHSAILSGYNPDNKFEENFRQMTSNAIGFYAENKDYFSFIEQYTYSPFLFKETLEESLTILEPLKKLLQQAKQNNEVKNLPDELLLSLVSGPITSMMRLFIAGKADLSQELLRKQLIEACWKSIMI